MKDLSKEAAAEIFISFRTDGGNKLAKFIADSTNIGKRIVDHIHSTSKRKKYAKAFFSQDEDAIDAGEHFPDVLRTAVRECTVFVCLLSPHSLDYKADGTDYFMLEIETAIESRKPIFVIRYADFKEESVYAPTKAIRRLLSIESKVNSYRDDGMPDDVLEQIQAFYNKSVSDNNARRTYNRTLTTNAFLRWQQAILHTIYEPEVAKCSGIEFVSFCGFDYEAVTYRYPTELGFPFSRLCRSPFDLNILDHSGSRINIQHRIDESRKERESLKRSAATDQARNYLRIINDTIFYPERIGYMLDRIDFSRDTTALATAHCDIYFSNLKDSHFLEYELYQLFRRRGQKPIPTREECDALLPWRRALHERCADEGGPLVSGKGRNSNYGVQLMIVTPNPKGEYCTLLMERSLTVAAKPGFWQIIPSGGFEAYGNATTATYQEINFDVVLALYRELLEECFGLDETDGFDNPYSVYRHEKIKNLQALIKNGKARFDFLGETMSLVGLRPELSFLLYIDDEEFTENLVPNYESRNIIQLVPIDVIYSPDFWTRVYTDPNAGEDYQKGMRLNCTTAGLLCLAREHSTVKSLLA